MKFFKSKVFVICLVVAIILTLVPTLIAAFGGIDLLRSTAGTIAKPFTFVGTKIAEAFNGFTGVFTEYDRLVAENESLKSELEDYEKKEYNDDILQSQNNWLKDYINFHESNPRFKITNAKIIARESGNYATVLTLNKGSVHGIKTNMPIITADGLLGYVSELALNWCKVTSVIEAKNSIGVYSNRQGAQGILEGDIELRKQGLCKITYINSNANLQIGDRIFTLGGSESIYPADLYIGEITDIAVDTNTGNMVATVVPAIDFTDISAISDVMIICGYEGVN